MSQVVDVEKKTGIVATMNILTRLPLKLRMLPPLILIRGARNTWLITAFGAAIWGVFALWVFSNFFVCLACYEFGTTSCWGDTQTFNISGMTTGKIWETFVWMPFFLAGFVIYPLTIVRGFLFWRNERDLQALYDQAGIQSGDLDFGGNMYMLYGWYMAKMNFGFAIAGVIALLLLLAYIVKTWFKLTA